MSDTQGSDDLTEGDNFSEPSASTDSDTSAVYVSSGSSSSLSDNSNWDDEYLFDDDDYFLNELSLPNSSQENMENEDGDGGYDDDTDVDDDVLILEPGHENEHNEGEGDNQEEDDDQDTDDEEDEDEREDGAARAGPPPRKVAKLEPNLQVLPGTSSAEFPGGNQPQQAEEDKDSDGFTCTICYDQFTNSGEHRISCLKCGHIFGKNCIEKWLKIHGRCPQCNCKAKKGEVRVLYVKSLQAVDNTDLTEAKKELEKAQITISKCTLESAKQKISIQSLHQQIQVLEKQNVQLKQNLSSSAVTTCSCYDDPEGSSSLPGSQIVPQQATCRKQLRYSVAKFFEIKEGNCRVGAYNEWMNMMVVSHDVKSSLFPNGSCGIKLINMLELRAIWSSPIHQKQIRDMQFSLCQNDVLLTVSLDKKATLHNCGGNVTVHTFQTEYPLWSCAWDEVHSEIFYLGCSNGSIVAYDMRSMSDPLAIYPQGQDKSPVCRLRYVNPTYQANAFNLNGLLVQKLNSVQFGEYRGGNISEMRFHQLPLEGPFFNVDYENDSRHMLVSTRPSPRNDIDHGRHLLCDLNQCYSDTLERNVVTSNVIQIYQGSSRDGQKISRPSLFSPEEEYVYVLANGAQHTVQYWDVSLSEVNPTTIPHTPDYVLDYTHCRVNSSNFLGLISEKGVRICNQTFE
ncbi:E3 ubiquitin-protein ligase RFWD3 isoform X2 [Folsomia candida]|uniref:E3 ubiquitin-protein ligase RFWD3 isoform X2 n=1 Tax=Folsomia candida TaxID=158441 RepID=UPI001604F158|nr:E3 ubiquitin-protein ligase RFWD3 isoform X2 [Folsomia candida]